MKNMKLIIAAAIMMTAIAANAQGIIIGYDSRVGSGYGLGSSFRDAVADRPAPAPASKPAAATAVSTITIDIRVIQDNAVKRETLTCAKGDAGAAVKNCRKASDGRLLTSAETQAYRLEAFFQGQGMTFRGQLRKAEGQALENCRDTREECAAWKVVRESSNGSAVKDAYETCASYVKFCND